MRRGLPWGVAGLGTVLTLVGLAVVLTAGVEPATVFTGGYSPLPLEDEELGAYRSALTLTYDGTVRLTVVQLGGAGLLVVGLLLLTGVGGWVAGRRSRPAA